MTSELQVPELASGLVIPIGPILDADGKPDDLTQYGTLRIVIETFDGSANVLNKTLSNAELEIDPIDNTIVNWKPTDSVKTPQEGFYFLQILRENTGPTQVIPSRIYALECTNQVITA